MTLLRYFNSDLDIKFTFIPQMIFLCCIFVYLCLQIVAKWLFFNAKVIRKNKLFRFIYFQGGYTLFGNFYPGARCAPSLLIGLINMFMMKSRNSGFVNGDEIDPICHLNYWYPMQVNYFVNYITTILEHQKIIFFYNFSHFLNSFLSLYRLVAFLSCCLPSHISFGNSSSSDSEAAIIIWY